MVIDPPPHLLAALGLELWTEDGVTHGVAELGPTTWAVGTERPRLGLLATMADMVAGMPPSGAINPTVDLSIQLMAPAPARAAVHLVCRPAKVGRRLFVGEVMFDSAGVPFARATVTFLNQLMPEADPLVLSGPGGRPETSIEERLQSRAKDDRTLVVPLTEATTNPGGTMQGGLQATVAEMASEWALVCHGQFVVTDLDIRYLGRICAGPLVATGEVVSVNDGSAFVRVELTDEADGRLGAVVSTVCRRSASLER